MGRNMSAYTRSSGSPLSKYSKDQRTILLSVSIVRFLESVGHPTRRGPSGHYYSFLREEKNPSLHIDDSKNLWFDHGVGRGGGLCDVVKALVPSCAGDRDEPVLDFLRDTFFPGMIPANDPALRGADRSAEMAALRAREAKMVQDIEKERSTRSSGAKRVHVISTLTPFTSRQLLEYFRKERFIPEFLVERYCREVHYRIQSEDGTAMGREYFAAGFPNRAGGWALRNPACKLSSRSDYSIVLPDGSFDFGETPEAGSGRVFVFEGFSDFLSWLAWNGIDTPQSADVVVLNSTSNLKGAIPFIVQHAQVRACLDNDDAGRQHTKVLKQACAEAGVVYVNIAPGILPSNDVNEAWAARERRRLAQTPKDEAGVNPARKKEKTPIVQSL